MNRREQDAHEDLCRRLVTALNERDAARAAVEGVRAIHKPSTDHGADFLPYCLGCWEAGGMDGAPTWPCPTYYVTDRAALGGAS